MGSKAVSAYGAKIKMGDGATPETFTEIPEVGDISGPELNLKIEDVTTHDTAAAGFYPSNLPTIFDSMTIKFPINYTPSEVMHVALRNAAVNRTKKNFQKVNREATETISFAGYVTGLGFSDPVTGPRSVDVEITIDGALTFS